MIGQHTLRDISSTCRRVRSVATVLNSNAVNTILLTLLPYDDYLFYHRLMISGI